MNEIEAKKFSEILERLEKGEKFADVVPDGKLRKVIYDFLENSEENRKRFKTATKRGERYNAMDIKPTDQRLKRDDGVKYEIPGHCEDDKAEVRARAKITCRHDWYFVRNYIDWASFRAGCIFMQIAFDAGLMPRTTVKYGEHIKITGDADDQLLVKSAANQELDKIYVILSPREWDVLNSVLTKDEYAGKGARMMAYHTGLAKLVGHFQIKSSKQSAKVKIKNIVKTS